MWPIKLLKTRTKRNSLMLTYQDIPDAEPQKGERRSNFSQDFPFNIFAPSASVFAGHRGELRNFPNSLQR
jgi:hypothetical protein